MKKNRTPHKQHKPDPDRKLFQEQLESEREQDDYRQKEKFADALKLQGKGKGEATMAGCQIIKDTFKLVCDGIKEYVQNSDVRGSQKTVTYKAFKAGRLENLAYIIIQTTLNGVWRGDYRNEYISRANLATKIGEKIEKEAKFAWSVVEKARCGAECLNEVMIKKTNLIEYCELPTENRSYNAMRGVKSTDYLDTHTEHFNLIFNPLYRPMVCEPDWWEGPYGGGYLNKERNIPIIKNAHPDQIEGMTPQRMPLVFKALNGIQAVPWKINKKLLDVMNELWEKDPEIFKSSKDKELNKAQVKLYLDEANRYAEKERFWLPANFDFRGRVFYLPFLSPQGPDMVRALLDFADGAMASRGALLPYGRTLYDDRTSHEERQKWYDNNFNNIRDVASKPLGKKLWMDAKEKWQFLKWCLECAANFNGTVTDYFTSIPSYSPVYVDGSCNAIQHIAALLKDEKLAKSVNMCPLPPQDIYSDITNALHLKLKEFSEKDGEGAEFAKEWLRLKIGRNDIKKTVMTIPYGRAEYMNGKDIYEKFFNRLRIKSKKTAATWMNEILWKIVAKKIPQNKLLMDWLREIAKQFNKRKKHIEWAVPSGFIVRHRYYKYVSVFVKLADQKGKFRIRKRTDDIDTRKSNQAIVANFVHSLDAASLIMTVCRLLDEGKKNFGVIHDCFGTPAGDMECLERCVRAGFVQTHHGDLLHLYHNSFYGALKYTAEGKTLPDPPQTGKFDVNTVYKASYLFS